MPDLLELLITLDETTPWPFFKVFSVPLDHIFVHPLISIGAFIWPCSLFTGLTLG